MEQLECINRCLFEEQINFRALSSHSSSTWWIYHYYFSRSQFSSVLIECSIEFWCLIVDYKSKGTIHASCSPHKSCGTCRAAPQLPGSLIYIVAGLPVWTPIATRFDYKFHLRNSQQRFFAMADSFFRLFDSFNIVQMQPFFFSISIFSFAKCNTFRAVFFLGFCFGYSKRFSRRV